MTDAHHLISSDVEAPHVWARFERDTWSRAARRARALAERQKAEGGEATKTQKEESKEPVLCIRCSAEWEEVVAEVPAALSFQPRKVQAVKEDSPKSSSGSGAPAQAAERAVRVSVQWTYGRDRAAFEACAKSLLQRMAA